MRVQIPELLANIDFYSFFAQCAKHGTSISGSGDWRLMHSPLRDDDDERSFSFNTVTGGWVDHAKGDKGNFISFLMSKENVDISGAIAKLYELAGKEKPKKSRTQPVKSAPLPEHHIKSKDIRKSWEMAKSPDKYPNLYLYLSARGINENVMEKYGLGITFNSSVIIPYAKDLKDNVLAWKEIKYDMEQTPVKKKIAWNSPLTIFPISVLSENTEIVVCEGEFDAILLNEAGIPAITFTTGANSTPTPEMLALFRNKTFTFLYDADEAGRKGSEAAANKLADVAAAVYIADWNDATAVDIKTIQSEKGFDVTDFLTKGGNADSKTLELDLLRIVCKAKPFVREKPVYKPNFFYSEKEWTAIAEEYKSDYIKEEKIKKADGSEGIKTTFYDLPCAKALSQICSIGYSVVSGKDSFIRYNPDENIWTPIHDQVVKNSVQNLLQNHHSAKRAKDVADTIKGHAFVDSERFNSGSRLLHLKNCAFDLDSLRDIQPRKEHYFTYRNQFNFDRHATCPLFDDFLKTISMDDELWTLRLWEIIGFCLTHEYTYQKMFWFWGQRGRNGKGTLLRVMQKLVGTAFYKDLDPKRLENMFYLQHLKDKRLAVCPDAPGFLTNLDVIKKLTGGDTISSGIKGQNRELEFVNTAKVIFAMNAMPITAASENLAPVQKRVVLLPFQYEIPHGKEDMHIERAFERELSGIFNKAVLGLKRLREQRVFTHVPRADLMMERWASNTNPLQTWLLNNVVSLERRDHLNWRDGDGIQGINGEFVNVMYKSYETWMDEHSAKTWQNDLRYCRNARDFSENLRAMYPHVIKEIKWNNLIKCSTTFFKGVRLLKSEEEYPEF